MKITTTPDLMVIEWPMLPRLRHFVPWLLFIIAWCPVAGILLPAQAIVDGFFVFYVSPPILALVFIAPSLATELQRKAVSFRITNDGIVVGKAPTVPRESIRLTVHERRSFFGRHATIVSLQVAPVISAATTIELQVIDE